MKKLIIALLISGLVYSCQQNESYYSGRKTIKANNSVCKTFSRSVDTIPADTDCVEYQYNLSSNALKINHYNAAFNCCIKHVSAEIHLDSNLITINEIEKLENEGCDCNCLYDIDYELTGLKPGIYFLKIVEPMLSADDQVHNFQINLTENAQGENRLVRHGYPWIF